MKTRNLLAASLLAALSSTVTAQVWLPAEGIWQVDGANGSGLTLDVRDNAIGIGLYSYDEAGSASWYSGVGTLVDGVLSTQLTRFERDTDGAPSAAGTLDITLDFSASATGTLSIGDVDAMAVRHFAFGADYIGGIELAGAHGVVTTVPDMRGRWIVAPSGSDGGESLDLAFIHARTSATAVSFSTALPHDGGPLPEQHVLTCGTDPSEPAAAVGCELKHFRWPPNFPPALARFDPADLSATRIAGEPSQAIAFRVPDGIDSPQSGIWQIAGRFGEGVTLDVRDNVVAIGVYGYDDDGKSTWSLATGPLEQDTDGQRMSADLLTFAGGSCLDCEHTDPAVADTRPVSVEFLGATRARMTIGEDAPLSISLLPFGASYTDLSFAGDPGAEEFGVHALPSLALGGWAQTSIRGPAEQGEAPRYPPVAFAFEMFGASLGSQRLLAFFATPGSAWGVDDDDPEPASIACTDGEGTDAVCGLTHSDISPLPGTVFDNIADIAPWNITANRISGHSAINGLSPEPVYLFRIPPRPQPAAN